MKWLISLGVCGGLGLSLLGGCPSSSEVRNPYLTYIEEYVGTTGGATGGTGSGSGSSATAAFRDSVTLTFRNNHTSATVDTSFVAWVNVSSLHSAEQQEALLADGYVQLASERTLGSAFTLPVGTFVLNGPGYAGATPVRLAAGTGDPNSTEGASTPATVSFSMITPDAILMFSQPPVSCDGVAFTFNDPQTGEVLEGISTILGGYKTYAQVDVYQCDPFKPGLFLNQTGGQFQNNEFDEGESIVVDFSQAPTAAGAFAIVTIAGS